MFLLCALVLGGQAHAALFDSLETKPPVPEPFDFELVKTDATKMLPDYLEVTDNGTGISKLKKVVFATLQVRFRKDLSAEAAADTAAASVDKQLKDEPALYQKLTDAIYERLVKELTARGITVADIGLLEAEATYQEGRKNAKPSGGVETFGALSVSSLRDKEGGEESASSIFGRLSNDAGGVPYYVYYATKAPGLSYGGMTGEGARIVEPNTLPVKLMQSAEGKDVGILTVGFEVRLSKFAKTETKGPFYNAAKVKVVPMMRTQLLAMRMTAENAKLPYPYRYHFDNDIQVEPRSRGTKRKGLLGAMTNSALTGYPWIELDGEVVTMGDGNTAITPIPTGFEAAFDKAMDAQIRLLMAAVDKQRAAK
jgi:hypothetical protein